LRRDLAVLRTPIEAATAIKAAAAALAAGGLIAGCAPVQMGAAAIVGNRRISAGQVNSQVSALSKAYKPYSRSVRLTSSQMPKQVLGWLIRFDIREDFARHAGITVSQSQAQQALAEIYSSATQQAQQAGAGNVSLTELAVANGLPPDLLSELGRYQAIELAYVKRVNGGKLPTSQAAASTVTAQFSKAECQTYKNVAVKVNPQYGTMNYKQDSVVAAPDTLSRAGGPSSKGSGAQGAQGSSGQAPSC
jgi:hypothetical protein